MPRPSSARLTRLRTNTRTDRWDHRHHRSRPTRGGVERHREIGGSAGERLHQEHAVIGQEPGHGRHPRHGRQRGPLLRRARTSARRCGSARLVCASRLRGPIPDGPGASGRRRRAAVRPGRPVSHRQTARRPPSGRSRTGSLVRTSAHTDCGRPNALHRKSMSCTSIGSGGSTRAGA